MDNPGNDSKKDDGSGNDSEKDDGSGNDSKKMMAVVAATFLRLFKESLLE